MRVPHLLFVVCLALGCCLPPHNARAVDIPMGSFAGFGGGWYAGPLPWVFYLFGDRNSVADTVKYPADREQYTEGLALPEYLGYFVVAKDYRLYFVNKTERELEFPDIVERLSAKGWDAHLFEVTRHQNIFRSYMTTGAPPDDSFVPQFFIPYYVSQDILQKKTKKIKQMLAKSTLLNQPSGATMRLVYQAPTE